MSALPTAEVMAAACSLAGRACAHQGLPVVIDDPTVLALVARLLDERETDPISVKRLTAANGVGGDLD